MKKVIMCCTHHFNSCLQVGSQNLARCFSAQGRQVLYISAPVTPLHFFAPGVNDLFARLRKVRGHSSAPAPNIKEFVPFSLLAPHGRFPLNTPFVARHWDVTAVPPAAGKIRAMGFGTADLVYVDNIFLWPVLKHVQAGKKVLRVMDAHDQFPGWSKTALKIAQSVAADVGNVVYSAEGLASYIEQLGAKRSMYLPNSVNAARFAVLPEPDRELAALDGPVIIFIGAVDRRLDVRMLKHAAQSLPHARFVMAGPCLEGVALKALPKNVLSLGPVPRERVPGLLAASSAGFIPFDTKNCINRLRGVRPLKVMEFMAAGLPTVSASWPGMDAFSPPVFLYRDKHTATQGLRQALEDPPDAETLRAAARAHDWSKAFEKLMHFLDLPAQA